MKNRFKLGPRNVSSRDDSGRLVGTVRTPAEHVVSGRVMYVLGSRSPTAYQPRRRPPIV